MKAMSSVLPMQWIKSKPKARRASQSRDHPDALLRRCREVKIASAIAVKTVDQGWQPGRLLTLPALIIYYSGIQFYENMF